MNRRVKAMTSVIVMCSFAITLTLTSACAAWEGEIKKLMFDGVECTSENIESGEYALQRPFNLVYITGSLSDAAQTFLDWMGTEEAMEYIRDEGYVVTAEAVTPSSCTYEGSVSLSGSTSVYPLMMVLSEEYMKLHPGVKITVQGGGSGQGISDAEAGIVDIGMISKELDEEAYPTLSYTNLCTDGITIIASENCPLENVTKDELYGLYANGTSIQGIIIAGIGRDSGSGTRSAFDEFIGIKTDYASCIDQFADTGFVMSLIQGNKKGDTIAYVSAGSV